MGDDPRGVAVTPHGDFVYVLFKEGISVIEVATNKVVDTINTTDDLLTVFTGIAIKPDGELTCPPIIGPCVKLFFREKTLLTGGSLNG